MRFMRYLSNRAILIAFIFLIFSAGVLAQSDTSSGTDSSTEESTTEESSTEAQTEPAATTSAGAPKNFSSTIYAGGSAGSMDGNGVRAQFGEPEAFAIADDGTMYVADTQNSTIRKIAPDGTVTTIAGQVRVAGSAEGPLGENQLCYPKGIDVDDAGNVYIADSGCSRIYRLSPDGQLTTLAGSGDGYADGPSREAAFEEPQGLAVFGNEIYVADKGNNAIRILTPFENDYNVITIAGSSSGGFGDADGRGSDVRFDRPVGLSPDAQGNLLVADYSNQAVRILTPSGDVTTLATGLGSLVTDAVVDDKGRYFVALYAYNDIAVLAPDGSILAQLNDFGIQINSPQDLEFGPDGALYVLSEEGNAIFKVTIEE
jgi:sugar lactone lactonase YvrE